MSASFKPACGKAPVTLSTLTDSAGRTAGPALVGRPVRGNTGGGGGAVVVATVVGGAVVGTTALILRFACPQAAATATSVTTAPTRRIAVLERARAAEDCVKGGSHPIRRTVRRSPQSTRGGTLAGGPHQTPGRARRAGRRSGARARASRGAAPVGTRREWDSNPRWVAPHTLSKRADSAAL